MITYTMATVIAMIFTSLFVAAVAVIQKYESVVVREKAKVSFSMNSCVGALGSGIFFLGISYDTLGENLGLILFFSFGRALFWILNHHWTNNHGDKNEQKGILYPMLTTYLGPLVGTFIVLFLGDITEKWIAGPSFLAILLIIFLQLRRSKERVSFDTKKVVVSYMGVIAFEVIALYYLRDYMQFIAIIGLSSLITGICFVPKMRKEQRKIKQAGVKNQALGFSILFIIHEILYFLSFSCFGIFFVTIRKMFSVLVQYIYKKWKGDFQGMSKEERVSARNLTFFGLVDILLVAIVPKLLRLMKS